jgi:hypothetical protein
LAVIVIASSVIVPEIAAVAVNLDAAVYEVFKSSMIETPFHAAVISNPLVLVVVFAGVSNPSSTNNSMYDPDATSVATVRLIPLPCVVQTLYWTVDQQ